jgi:hypothetical protein
MITTGAVLRGDRARLLAYDPSEHPVALRCFGSQRKIAERPRERADFASPLRLCSARPHGSFVAERNASLPENLRRRAIDIGH